MPQQPPQQQRVQPQPQPIQPEPPVQKVEEIAADESMQIEVDENGVKKGKVIFKKIFQVRKKSSGKYDCYFFISH